MQRMRKSGSVPFQGVEPERIEAGWTSATPILPAWGAAGRMCRSSPTRTWESRGLAGVVGEEDGGDGTLPWARTKGLWDCLYQRGVVCWLFTRSGLPGSGDSSTAAGSGGRAGPDLRHRGTGGEVAVSPPVLGNRFSLDTKEFLLRKGLPAIVGWVECSEPHHFLAWFKTR